MHSAEPTSNPDALYTDELDLGALLEFTKQHWRLLLFSAVIGAAAGVGLSFLFKRVYQADAVLIAADDFGISSQAGGPAGLGGVASLIGISLPTNRQSQEAIATLTSRALIEGYISDQHLLPILFPKAWDPEKQAWRSSDPRKIPTVDRAYKLFAKGILKVAEDKKSGLVVITVRWTDPALAAQWVSDLVTRTNALLRTKAIQRSNRNLAYLNGELDKTMVVELRAAIYKLVETEIKKMMIAQGSEDYAFRYVDPPVTPERPVSPKRILFLLGGGIVGLLIGGLGIYLASPAKLT